jgi:hypothetical protein
MVFLVLTGCDFNGLAGKRLTPPASFFFILLFPCGSGQNSYENGLWKSEEPAIQPANGAAQGCSPLYAEKTHASTAPNSMHLLIYRLWILEIQQLIVAAHNAITNHLGRPAFLRLAIRIKRFLHAGAAVSAMRTLKAAAQTRVAMVAVTKAIAGHLIQNRTGLGSSFVRSHLSGSNQSLVRKLLLRENGRQGGTGLGRRGVKRRDLSGLVYELRVRHAGSKKKG